MTTTTTKNVGGGSRSFAKAAQPAQSASSIAANDAAARQRYEDEAKEKAAAEKPYPDAEHQPVDETKRGPLMIVIDGAGTMPLIDNNGRRVMRGEPVEVSEEEVAWLTSTNSGFKRV